MSEDSESRGLSGGGVVPATPGAHSGQAAFQKVSGWVLAYTVLIVIVFGAFVRASLSGDGCGIHWPNCGETLLPVGHPVKTWIEFTHRLTSGILLLGVVGLYLFSRRVFPAWHVKRKAAGWAVALTLLSAGIGAALVLNSWVVFDKSVARAITMPLHLMNNYLLVGALIMAALPLELAEQFRPKRQGEVGALLWSSAAGLFVLGATGALSAMGKTAFEQELKAAGSLTERINLHLGPGAEPLLKGGVIHPLIATSVLILILFACRIAVKKKPGPGVEFWAKATTSFFIGQMGLGLVNLIMSAPVWMQLVHLVLAILSWGSLVMTAVHAFQRSRTQENFLEGMSESQEAGAKPAFMSIVKAYVALTKPRVISLLLFTTVFAMVIAQGGWPPIWQILLVTLGGYMAAGAANTFNMIVEKDLDVAMERTAKRPTVTNILSTGQTYAFGVVMTVGSFLILTFSANVLSALLAFAGLLFYVFIYTLALKRRTWQNIVIGGAAGAFPPLVGYAAVRGDLSPFAWVLFSLIFFWTPVHFWALAILIKDDYAKAGVPMLPVVKGERATVIQIVIYAVLTAIVSIIPLFQREVGLIYLGGSALLNVGLLLQSLQLMRDTTHLRARALFKYSMVYLALMFVVTALDRTLWMS